MTSAQIIHARWAALLDHAEGWCDEACCAAGVSRPIYYRWMRRAEQ